MHNNAHKNGRSPLADTVPCEPGLQGEARRVEPSKSTALWLPQGRMAKDVGPSRSAGEQNIQTLYALLEFGVERRFSGAAREQVSCASQQCRRAGGTDRRIERIAARCDLWFDEPAVPIPSPPARTSPCVPSRSPGEERKQAGSGCHRPREKLRAAR
jgi:hypothetical protein